MDFGGLGLDNLVGPQNGGDAHQSQLVAVSSSPSSSSLIPEKDIKPVVHGSRFIKQGRSFDGEDDKGASKMAKPGDLSGTKMITMPLLHQGTPLLRSNSSLVAADDNNNSSRPQEQMLSFSSTQSEVSFLSRSNNNVGLLEKSPQSKSINFPPYFQPTTASAYARTTGYGGGSLNTGMHGGVLTGINGRSGFSPSQLIELEHQALIFKYIYTNVPVPSNLINPLKKSLYPCGGLSYSSAGSYAPNSYGWGTFHLGYSGNADPEPGRCRRTDGKKWRCSRDAVPDQKYCERHINRGRHRSRKPVEGRLTSAAASGETAATTNAAKLVVPVTSSSLSMTSVVTTTGGGVSSNSLAATRQFKSLQPGGCATAKTSSSTLANRVQTSRDVSMMSPAVDSKTSESTFTFPKQDLIFEDSSNPLFGVVPSDSLLNPSQRTSFLDFTEQQTQDQNLLRQFVDDWPKDDSTRSVISWADELKSDWTQLSMSIPIVSTEFSSSSSSPAQEKLAVSPLRLSSDFDPIQMGLGVEPTPKHADWMSVPWENSMGGPLGEVLTNSTNTNSPQMGSSPTGVLQKSTFCSLSNSSSTSSPRVDNMKGLYEEVLGSGYVSSCNVPAMLPGK